MKVLMVIPYLAAVYGGPAKVAQELSRSLGHLGIQVDLVTTNANGADLLDVPLDQWIEKENYRIQYFSCWHRNDFIISLPFINWIARNIAAYDVVHINNIFAPLMLLTEQICQFYKTPYVVTPHGMLEPWALSYKAEKKRHYYNFLEKPALQRASAIHALNDAEAKHIQSLGFSRTVVIPNGIDRAEFETLSNPESFYQEFPQLRSKKLILFLGRIDPKKGLDLLAPAFARVYHQFPQTHLVVAGPDNIGFLSTVKGYFFQEACLEAVTFTGMLTGALKRAALSAASLYVAPSYSEGFSMSILEGMATGLPCIITTACNFPEAASSNAALVVDAKVDSLATAMLHCLHNPDEAKQMGDRAREFILKNYTWEHSAERLVRVYAAIENQTLDLSSVRSREAG